MAQKKEAELLEAKQLVPKLVDLIHSTGVDENEISRRLLALYYTHELYVSFKCDIIGGEKPEALVSQTHRVEGTGIS